MIDLLSGIYCIVLEETPSLNCLVEVQLPHEIMIDTADSLQNLKVIST